MTSPARQHREQCAAIESAQDIDLSTLTPYQQLYKQLRADKLMLKDIKSHQDKQQAKAEMLPHYAQWLQGVIESGTIAENDQITPTLIVWQIDCGWLDETLPLAQIAISSKAESPDEFARTLPEVMIEQYAEQITRGGEISPENLAILLHIATAKNANGQHVHNLPDVIRAKLLRAAGEYHEHSEPPQPEIALSLYSAAVDYHEKIGAKKDISRLKTALNKT